MGFFSDFFSKEPDGPPVQDLTWIHKTAKWNGALQLLAEDRETIFVSWFAHTGEEFALFARQKQATLPEIKDARRVTASTVENKTVVFLEHYPLFSKEENLLRDWQAKKIYVLNSLDEPLLLKAGGERIADLMRKMGLEENESLEHTLIGKSITRLQKKLEKQTPFESSASSAEEWFKRNGKG